MNSPRTGQARLGHRPSKKRIKQVVATIQALTDQARTRQEATELVGRLSRTLRGWANYFQAGPMSKAYRAIDTYTAAPVVTQEAQGTAVWVNGLSPRVSYQALGMIRLSALKRNLPWADP